MLNFIYRQKPIFIFFLFWAIFLGLKPNLSFANFIDSKKSLEEVESKFFYLERIKNFLENKEVKNYLKRLGMDKEIILERIEKLEPDKLRELALRCDMFKVGGNSGVFIGILVIFLLVFIVLYLTNYTIKIEPRDAIPRRY